MSDVVESVRQVLQDFLAPELRQHRAELVSLRSEMGFVRSGLTSKIEALKSEVHAMQVETRSGFSAHGAALENAVLRGELSTTRELADLRGRVEKLERGQLSQ